MTVTGPDFIALQVRDLDRAAAIYQTHLGLRRAPVSPPGAVVFDTAPTSFAVREPLPGWGHLPLAGDDLDAVSPRPGVGVALWLHADDWGHLPLAGDQALHDSLAGAGVPIVGAPSDGPFGRTFTFADPDGYAVTIHDRA